MGYRVGVQCFLDVYCGKKVGKCRWRFWCDIGGAPKSEVRGSKRDGTYKKVCVLVT